MSRVENINSDGSIDLSFLDEFEVNLEREWSFLPFSDFKRWISEDDMWIRLEQFFPTSRLSRVRQLGVLSHTGPELNFLLTIPSSHTRLLHTQQVALIGKEIIKQNGGTVDDQEQITTIGMLHDIATPALGDATKLVDKKNLDEEDHWQDILEEEHFSYLKARGFSIAEIDRAIHNEGILEKF